MDMYCTRPTNGVALFVFALQLFHCAIAVSPSVTVDQKQFRFDGIGIGIAIFRTITEPDQK